MMQIQVAGRHHRDKPICSNCNNLSEAVMGIGPAGADPIVRLCEGCVETMRRALRNNRGQFRD